MRLHMLSVTTHEENLPLELHTLTSMAVDPSYSQIQYDFMLVRNLMSLKSASKVLFINKKPSQKHNT